MARDLCLILCSHFDREVRAVATFPEFRDIHFANLPVDCDMVEARWEGLETSVGSRLREGHSVCLVGSYCLTRAAQEMGGREVCPVSHRSQCVEWIADKDVLVQFLREEALLLLPGWLKDWRAHIERRWPADEKGAREFFRGSRKKLVLLDTGLYPRIDRDLKDFARFLRLPGEIYPSGLGFFQLSLGQIVLSWRLERTKGGLEERLSGLTGQITEYGRIGHLLGSVTKAQGEDEAQAGILEIFQAMLSPQRAAFHPAETLSESGALERTLRDRILTLNAEYAWTQDQNGLFLRVAQGRDFLGVVEISGLPFPDRREHDLGLALALAKISGLALSNSRMTRALAEERARTRFTEAALEASEEKVRSVFMGVPVGIYRATPQGEIVDANPALARMLGYPDVAALRAVNAWDLHLNPADRESWQGLLEGDHYVESFETQLRRRDGTIIWVRDTARTVKDRHGRILFYDGTIEDITKKKQTDAILSWNFQVKTSEAAVSERLLTPTPIEEMSAVVLEHARRLTSSATSLVGYVDQKTARLVAAAMTPDAGTMAAGHPDRLERAHDLSAMWQWALQEGKSILANVPSLDPRFSGLPDWHLPVGQFLAVPAIMSGSIVGLIVVANADHPYEERDLEAVERLATLYAIAVHRTRTEDALRDLSLVDDLTGLYNRRAFMALSEQQVKIANRTRKDLSLLFADLDDLKKINDSFGHEEGDRALADAAGVLRDAFRESDIIARIGGDEFAVLAIDASDWKPANLARRIRDRVSALNAGPGRSYLLSLSLGIARYDPDKPCSVQDLLALADRKMYEDKTSKKNGRPLPA
jgi:diguanylate cyclase (GGDEF)-like protein/PAS domain S-box-containing protein